MPGAKTFHAWTFRRLYDDTAYKVEVEGIDVTQVDPGYTSTRCSKCGTTLDENRTTQARFCCQKCGYEVIAYDVAGAIRSYSVTGGTPMYLTLFDRERALAENISSRILSPTAVLYNEPEFLFRIELRKPAAT